MDKPHSRENAVASQASAGSTRSLTRRAAGGSRKRISDERNVVVDESSAADSVANAVDASSLPSDESSSVEAATATTPSDAAQEVAAVAKANESASLAAMAASLAGGGSVLPIAGGLAAAAGVAAALGGGRSSGRAEVPAPLPEMPVVDAHVVSAVAATTLPSVSNDSIAPAAPAVLIRGVAAGGGAGIVRGIGTPEDPILMTALGKIELDLAPNADWNFSLDGGKTWRPGVNGAIPGGDLNEGANTVQIVQVDEAGRLSPTTTIEVVKDTTAPEAPVLDEAYSRTRMESVFVVGSGTSDDPLVMTSSGRMKAVTEPDAEWRYSTDGGATWKAGTADGVAASDLVEGNNLVTIVQIDAAGNASQPSTFSVLKDTIAPNAPTVDLSAYGSGEVLLGRKGMLIVSTDEPGSDWRFSLDGGQTFNTGVGRSLPVSFLVEGQNHVLIEQVDRAGNASAPITVDVVKDSIVGKPSVFASNFVGYASDGLVIFDVRNPGKIFFDNVEQGGHIEYVSDAGWQTLDPSGFSVADFYWRGRLNVDFRQVDAAGNAGETVRVGYYVNSYETMSWWDADVATPVANGTTAVIG